MSLPVLVLKPEALAAREARRWVRGALESRGLLAVVDVAELLLTEVVTNAVLHAGTRIEVSIGPPTPDGVRLEVRDGSGDAPVRRLGLSRTATTGRGTRLLDSLASRWGWEPTPDGGKVTWFLVPPDHGDDVSSPEDLMDRWAT